MHMSVIDGKGGFRSRLGRVKLEWKTFADKWVFEQVWKFAILFGSLEFQAGWRRDPEQLACCLSIFVAHYTMSTGAQSIKK
jgi:hypothetical protein